MKKIFKKSQNFQNPRFELNHASYLHINQREKLVWRCPKAFPAPTIIYRLSRLHLSYSTNIFTRAEALKLTLFLCTIRHSIISANAQNSHTYLFPLFLHVLDFRQQIVHKKCCLTVAFSQNQQKYINLTIKLKKIIKNDTQTQIFIPFSK